MAVATETTQAIPWMDQLRALDGRKMDIFSCARAPIDAVVDARCLGELPPLFEGVVPLRRQVQWFSFDSSAITALLNKEKASLGPKTKLFIVPNPESPARFDVGGILLPDLWKSPNQLIADRRMLEEEMGRLSDMVHQNLLLAHMRAQRRALYAIVGPKEGIRLLKKTAKHD